MIYWIELALALVPWVILLIVVGCAYGQELSKLPGRRG